MNPDQHKAAWREAIGQAATAGAVSLAQWDVGLAVHELASSPTSAVAYSNYRRINARLSRPAGDKAVLTVLSELCNLGWLRRRTGIALGWELTTPVRADALPG